MQFRNECVHIRFDGVVVVDVDAVVVNVHDGCSHGEHWCFRYNILAKSVGSKSEANVKLNNLVHTNRKRSGE